MRSSSSSENDPALADDRDGLRPTGSPGAVRIAFGSSAPAKLGEGLDAGVGGMTPPDPGADRTP
ncbi:MAG: hypothetical protein ACLPWO_02555 [Thermoplasmata archaeon]